MPLDWTVTKNNSKVRTIVEQLNGRISLLWTDFLIDSHLVTESDFFIYHMFVSCKYKEWPKVKNIQLGLWVNRLDCRTQTSTIKKPLIWLVVSLGHQWYTVRTASMSAGAFLWPCQQPIVFENSVDTFTVLVSKISTANFDLSGHLSDNYQRDTIVYVREISLPNLMSPRIQSGFVVSAYAKKNRFW